MRWVCFALALCTLAGCVQAVVDHNALYAAINGAGTFCWFDLGLDR